MSEVARRNAVKPLDNGSRFARIERRIDTVEARVTALEKWRASKGKPVAERKERSAVKRTSALPKPKPPVARPKPVTAPVPRETGGIVHNPDWKPNWERILQR